MVPRRYRVLLWTAPLLLGTWLFSAFSNDDPQGFYQFIFVGLFWGTMFGHTTLAAAWAAFGPGPLLVRLPLSLFWVAMLPVAVAINLSVNSGPGQMAVPIGICLLGQWLALQFPLWGLALWLRLRLQCRGELERNPGREALQFTIRQLVVVTAVVGVIFGVGRVLLPVVAQNYAQITIFALLCAAAIVLTLPLVLAALLHRFAVPGVLLVLALIAAATAWESPAMQAMDGTSSVPPELLAAINAGTALMILAVLAIVRMCGYSLVPQPRHMQKTVVTGC
ncbi:MAG TPA: hypothetical protein VFV87_05640 [Pirellulaceae bacterium]|nr:hypothetical protein [Pirellulaceae bacterium]